MHSTISLLIKSIEQEEAAQAERYNLNQTHTLRQMKAEGLALHPISVTHKSFGYADYPEVDFKILYPADDGLFKDGCAVECFVNGEEPLKGILLQLDGKKGSLRLYAPDFPDWIEDTGLGIKLAPDTRTSSILKTVLGRLPLAKELHPLFNQLHRLGPPSLPTMDDAMETKINFNNASLNASQQKAVDGILQNKSICIVHGPPGTGKTTTLAEAIWQLTRQGQKVLVTAASNAAVDHLCIQILKLGIALLRVGNTGKVADDILPHTAEGKMQNSHALKEIKQLKKRAEEFRRMAYKYKRQFGKAEREQRQLLFKEVKSIREQIKKLQQYHEEKFWAEAQVVAGTPIGLYDSILPSHRFNQLLIDEAGQCTEPHAWCVFSMAPSIVLAGDPYQLPPTVLSNEAKKNGLQKSILEIAMESHFPIQLLDVQYRMKPAIAGFSNQYFYEGRLQTAAHLKAGKAALVFIDTAGAGFSEQAGPDGSSLQNKEELMILNKYLTTAGHGIRDAAFISPYAGQVALAKEILPQGLRCSTIDSFQGQEMATIFLSLVRSNDDNEIGFLKDYRRMNVAITRAKQTLLVIGDSATIGADPFYKAFIQYVEQHGTYQSVWEYDWD